MSDSPSWSVLQGDCLATMRGMDDSSVDLIATDPPYGISFMGKTWDKALPDPAIWRECLRVLKPGASACVMSGSRLDCLWRMCRDLEEAGFELSQTALYWVYRNGFPKGGDLSKMADKQAGAEREVVGNVSRTGWGQEKHVSLNASRYQTSGVCEVTVPTTDLAVSLDGWFTRGKVKPAVEVIIWARKPNSERTELANMERWGVGGVNCGACMVPHEDPDAHAAQWNRSWKNDRWVNASPDTEDASTYAKTGRFPANLLCMDDALGAGSRYFDVDAWAAEHGYSEDGWAEASAAGLLQVAKPSRTERHAGIDNPPGKQTKGRMLPWQWERHNWKGNNHPTCKPVRLFAYLCDFLCPTGGTVLDPFCGSGTTGVSAVQSGRNFIGCELEPDYVSIAEARIAHASSVEAQHRLAM